MAVQIPQPSVFRIDSLFKDNRFLVPLYQRNYAWESSEIDDFWRDLSMLIEGDRTSHFFGQMVTFNNTEKQVQEIIDGQQRLTTVTLFLAALRDLAKTIIAEAKNDIGENEQDDLRVLNKQVRDLLVDSATGKPTLVVEEQTAQDPQTPIQHYFFQLTHQDTESVPDVDPHQQPYKNLRNAYDTLLKQLKKAVWREKTWAMRARLLERFYDRFTQGFYVVVISALNQREAFIIFETLNTRGKDLTAADIIKNHVMYISNDLVTANTQWRKMSDYLKGDSDRITRFIRTYWAARKTLVQVSALYRSLSETNADLSDANQAREFLTDLNFLVPVYDALENPRANKANKEIWNNDSLYRQVDILARMRVILYYPIMLAMWKRGMKTQEMVLIMNKVTSVFVRHRMIRNDTTNKLESGYANIARRIWSGDLPNVDAILKEMDEKLIQSDDAVKASFSVLTKEGKKTGQKKWSLMYMLTELIGPDEDIDFYDSAFQDDDYQLVQVGENNIGEEYLEYVGNWTILEKHLVPKLEKAETDEQRAEVFDQSVLQTNKKRAAALRRGAWDDDAILAQQQEFANQAVTIW
ncbi:DUF262 domain-containing protein [Schleiferilactobacillus shenzhenensis]|nr:DUF262 domain-containing protein [Schleiferilactobacillus shenzhenensis]